MKVRSVILSLLFSGSGALVVGFAVKTILDRRHYGVIATGAPFALNITLNALFFLVPAVILADAGLLVLRKTLALWICGGVFAGIFAGIELISAFSARALDGLIYAFPALISAVVCVIFALISRKLLTKQ